MADEFDAAVAAAIQGQPAPAPADPASAARFGMQQAVGTNPDLQAELQRVAAKTGVPVGTVASYPDEMKRQATLGSIDFQGLAATAPSTARLLADIDKAKVAHDDVGPLTAIERAVRSYVGAGDGTPNRSYIGASTLAGVQDLLGVGATLLDHLNPFTTSPEEAAVLFKNDPAGLKQYNEGPAGFLGRARDAMSQASQQTMTELSPEAQRDYGGLQYATTDLSKAAYTSPVRLVGDAVRSLPTSLAMAVSVYLTRGAAAKAEADALAAGATPIVARQAGVQAASKVMANLGATTEGAIGYAQQANQTVAQLQQLSDDKLAASPEYQKLLQEGYSPESARQLVVEDTGHQAGLLAGVVDAAVNHVGGQVLGRLIGEGGKLLPRVGKGALTEALTETVQSGGEQLGQNMATQRNVDPQQSLSEGVLENMIQGFAAGGLTGGFFSGFGGMHRAEIEAHGAQQQAELVQQVMQTAAASKLRERDAATFEGFMQAATQDGPLEKLYVNPQELQKAGVDLTQLAEVAPSFGPQLAQALQTGTDVAIPTSELATRLPGTPLEQPLLDHLKTDPGGFSRVGAQEYLQTQGDAIRQEVEKQMAEHQADSTFKESMKAVEDDVRQQLGKANRFTDDVNAPYAAMWASFFGVQAARLGVLPQQLYEQFAPRIVAQTPAGALLDQDVALKQGALTLKDNPDFAKWFGTSAAVDDAGHPKLLYHGTADDFHAFDQGESGKNVKTPASKAGFFFTDRADVAQRYAEMREGTQQIMPVYLSLQDPARKTVSNMVEADKFLAEGYKGDGAIITVRQADGREQTVYAVKNATQIKSAFNQGTYDPANPSILHQGDRAEVTRGSFDPHSNTVALLKAADLSTFLHESGHFFLEVLDDVAAQKDAPQALRDDFDAFLRWTGVEAPAAAEGDKSTAADRRAAAWRAMSLEEKRAHHEDFARGFEAYLFEGKAPSIELQGVFQRFRAWLLQVYRSIAQLNVSLTPEIRGVFDRMLASTDEIRTAEDARGYEALFKNKPEGMTADEWAVYQLQANDATQQAIQDLQARSLRDMQWLANAKSRELKRLQKEAAKRRGEIEGEVRKEVEAQPVYQAIAAIKEVRKSDPQDRAAVKAWQEQRDAEQARVGETVKGEYLASPEGSATKGIERGQFLARSKRAMANEVERRMLEWEQQQNPKPKVNIPEADLQAVAELHGFTSADHLQKAIAEAQPIKDVIEGMTDQRMLERYGDLVDERAIERAAEEAIHNEARLRFTATELNALRKATGEPALLAKAVRQFATDIIARTRVRDLKPSVYTAAEKRAANEAAKAAAANKLQDAAVQKRNQLINGYAAKAALEARGEVDKIVAYLAGFNRESLYKSLDAEYIDQIHAMLERFDLRAGQSLRAIDKRTSLAEWLKSQEEAGLEPDIPPELADEANRTSYKNLTMEQLRGLRDTVKQIEHLGRLKHKLLTAKDQRDYEAIRDSIVASIHEHAGDKLADNRTRPTALDAGIRMFNGYLLEHRKVASLIREMDGFKDGGTFWEYFVRSMNEAGDREATMRAEAADKLATLVKPMLEGGKRGGRGEFFETVGKSFNREERLGIALNMGNAGNMQRLLDGEGWTLAQIKPILDTLTEADWHFVQNVWDYLETFRPLVAAKERRVYGKEPNWVEPQPLTVQSREGKTMQLRGGYYPIKYDTARSGRAEAHADAETAKQMMRGAYTSSTTRRSFTKSRAEEVSGRPLMYSTDGLFNGVNEIIHDLSWHEWLIDANRLLRSKSIDNAVRSRYGAEVARQLKSAVRDIAAGEFPATHAFERAMTHLRVGTMMAGLGLNILNSVINVQGITQSFARIGAKWTAVGIGKFAAGPVELSREVAGKSAMMANRAKTLNREVNEIQSLVRDKSKARQVTDRIMFLPLTITQQVVDVPTWWGAYQKALDSGEQEARAVSLADQAVLDAQSGGQVKDLAGIQRGGPLLMLWSRVYGFFNSTYNLSVEATKATNFKDPMQVVGLTGKYMMLWWLPALMGTLLKNLFTGGDWDPDKLAKKAAGDQVSYLMGMMVGLRELTAGVQAATGTSDFGASYSGPAGARFVSELTKLAQQAHQGEADAAFMKALSNVIGVLFRLPSTQVNRTVEGAIALKEGQTKNPLAVIAGPPPKQ